MWDWIKKMIKILTGSSAHPPPPPPPPGQLHPVTFSPNGGSISNVNCELNCVDAGAHIFYTLGANPLNPTHIGDSPTGSTIRIGSNDGVVNSGPGLTQFKALSYEKKFTDSEISTSNTFGSVVTLKPIQSGFFQLLAADTPNNPSFDLQDILNNWKFWTQDYMDGFRYRGAWNQIEPNEGEFHFDNLDALAAKAEQTGKVFTVNLAGGVYTPRWVFDSGAYEYITHLSKFSGQSQPLSWDPAFQSKWFAFMQAFFDRYGGNDSLRAIIDCGFMASVDLLLGDDVDKANMPFVGPGFSFSDVHQAYYSGANAVLERQFLLFPNIGHVITYTKVWDDNTSDGTVDANHIRDAWFANHPQRTGVIITSARGHVPPHPPPPPENLSSSPQYFQEFRAMCTGPAAIANYYVPPLPLTLPPPLTRLQDCLEFQWFLGKNYGEIYRADNEFGPDADAIFELEHPRIIGNLQPPT